MKKLLLLLLPIILFLCSCGSEISQGDLVTPEPSIATIESIAIVKSTPIVEKEKAEESVVAGSIIAENNIEENDEEENSISFLVVGDNLFHNDNLKSAYNKDDDTYDFSSFYTYVKPYIQSVDVAVANFETVTAGREATISSYPQFNTPDEILYALEDAGFDLLTTANNHCLDRGYEGVVRTLNKIDENNMLSVGTSLDEKIRWTDIEVKGVTIRNLAYTYACNGNIYKLNDNQLFMINLLDEKLIKEHIERAKNDGIDLINVYLHWGVEYLREPAKWQEEFAVRLFNYGADIIFATHPHVIQKSEVYQIDGEDKYIIYSTGNYISNFSRNDGTTRPNKLYTEDGVMVQATFSIDENHNVKLNEVIHIPTWPYKYYINDIPQYAIIPIPDITTLYTTDYHNLPNQSYMISEAIDSYHRTFESVINYKAEE